MFQPIALYLGVKYIFSRSRDGFVSFISTSAIVGLSLGVAILITVCSIMNGFDKAMHDKLADKMRYIEVGLFDSSNYSLDEVTRNIKKISGVKSVAPYVVMPAAINVNNIVLPLNLYGINNHDLHHFGIDSHVLEKFDIVVTNQIKQNLYVGNDKASLIVPGSIKGVFGSKPVIKSFNISSLVANSINGPGGYINFNTAMALQGRDLSFNKLSVAVEDIKLSHAIANKIRNDFDFSIIVIDWTNRFESLFKALAMQKTMMVLVLSLLIIMACFSLLSSLVMMVKDRQSEIAILRTMGFSSYSVMLLFLSQGFIAGIVGIIFGVCLGCLLSYNVGAITSFIESVIGKKLVSADVYWVDVLPSELLISDIVFVVSVAFLLSILATLYPAYKASKLSPSKVLRSRG